MGNKVGDLTMEELRAIIREEAEKWLIPPPPPTYIESDLSDFPLDDLGPWPEWLTLRREDMYDDDGR